MTDLGRITVYYRMHKLSDQNVRYMKVAPKKILENACAREAIRWSNHTSSVYSIVHDVDRRNTNYVRKYQPFDNYWSWRVNQGQRRMRMNAAKRRAEGKPYSDHYARMMHEGRGFTSDEMQGIRTIAEWYMEPHPFPWLLAWMAAIALIAAQDNSWAEFLLWGIGAPLLALVIGIAKAIIVSRWQRWRSPLEEIDSDDEDWGDDDDDDEQEYSPKPVERIVVPTILRFNIIPFGEETMRI